MKRLVRIERSGVHIVGCVEGTIAFGFTERTGGASTPPFASLNLGAHVGDDPQAVAENRRRVLRAVGASSCAENLLVPNQVHSDHVAVVRSSDPSVLEAARAEIADGSDAIVCTAPDVPVMLCFADCVPVILTAPGGFAVVAIRAGRARMRASREQRRACLHGRRRARQANSALILARISWATSTRFRLSSSTVSMRASRMRIRAVPGSSICPAASCSRLSRRACPKPRSPIPDFRPYVKTIGSFHIVRKPARAAVMPPWRLCALP